MGTTETTTYRVETVYALDDKASAGLGAIDAAAGKATRSTHGLTGAIGRLGAMAVGGAGLAVAGKTLIGFNSGLEQSRITITGLLQLNHPGEKWADNFGRAERLVDRFTVRMKAAVGTTEDAVAMASMLVNPISAAGGSMKQLENFSVGATVAAKALNIQSDVAARDVAEALTGRLTATSTFAKALLQPMGYSTKSFNALSADKRLAEMDKALNSPALKKMAAAQENTWAGVTSTLEDNLKIAIGKVGLPLFKALTEEMKDWNKWLDANQDKVAEFGKTLSDGLVTGFRAVKSAVQFLVEHSDTIIAIGKVWAVTRVAGAVGGWASNLAGGAGGIRELLGTTLGKGQRSADGKFIKGLGVGDAAGPVAMAAAAGWQVGRMIDEATGAGASLVDAIDNARGGMLASTLAAQRRSDELDRANRELQKQITAAAARFAGKGGALESTTSTNVAGVAANLRARANHARDVARESMVMDLMAEKGRRDGSRRIYSVGGLASFYAAQGLDMRAQRVENKHAAAVSLTDTYVGLAWRELNATQRSALDRAAGTEAVMREINRRLSQGAMPFLGVETVKELLLGGKDKDAFNSASKKPPNVNIGTLKVEVAAKDPDRWLQVALGRGLEKARRAPTTVGAARRMRGGL